MDHTQYMAIFLDEGRDELHRVNDLLLRLERLPDDRETTRELYRLLHTFKGMASTLGLEAPVALVHAMESLLDAMRRGHEAARADWIERLFAGADLLGRMLADLGLDRPIADDAQALVLALEAAVSEARSLLVPEALAALPDEPLAFQVRIQGPEAWAQVVVRVTLEPACLMKSVRASMIAATLETLGQVVAIAPSLDELERSEGLEHFEVVLRTDAPNAAIEEAVLAIAEVRAVAIGAELVPTALASALPLEHLVPVAFQTALGEASGGPFAIRRHKTVRVSTDRLDALMDWVGELALDRARLAQWAEAPANPAIGAVLEHLAGVTQALEGELLRLRMVPVESVFNRFPRMVRDLARELGKEVELQIEGPDTPLDRGMADALGEALLHLVRNSLAHGLETPAERLAAGKPARGVLRIGARLAGDEVAVELTDDGRGLARPAIVEAAIARGLVTAQAAPALSDEAVYHLIFEPGFSTANATSHLSGRGVGMDVVRERMRAVGGTISIASTAGRGLAVELRLPVAAPATRALLAEVGGELYGIPLDAIEALYPLGGPASAGPPDLPLVHLRERFDVRSPELDASAPAVLVVRGAGRRVGLVVERLLGQQALVLAPLAPVLGEPAFLAGAALLDDGRVALVVDARQLAG